MVLWAGFAGAMVGVGLVVIYVGATRPAQSLSEVVSGLHGAPVVGGGPGIWRNEVVRSQRRRGAALELCELTPEEFVRGRVVLAVEFAAIPLVIWLAGKVGIVPMFGTGLVWMVMAVVGVVAGWALGAVTLHSEVKERTDEWNSGLAAFTELIGLMVAGGAGLETATVEAAAAGQGQVFRHLSSAVSLASARREPPWPTLRALGERFDLDGLVEFSESMALAADGARVSEALVARAEIARQDELSRELADAESTSESMTVPVTLMLAGVFIIIGFPIVVTMTAF